ncbi:MAG: sugar phosphate isomerase/epimerase [Clostridia bacterium]|nr:sugar phosphate isomerase/epimerase [Clostridia bacterium]
MEKLGLQLFTVRNTMDIEEGVRYTFKKISEIGYTQVQTAGISIPAETFKSIADEYGIEIVGTHGSFNKLIEDPDKAMREHEILGTKNVGIGGFWPKSLDDLKEFIEKANKFAEIIGKEGYKFTYHNHGHEFAKYTDKTIMQTLVDELDKDNTSFVLDTCWVQYGGASPVEWINKLAGRIEIIHLKDIFYSLIENKPLMTEIGNGNLNFHDIIEACRKTGVKYYVVEQDICPVDPFESIKQSADYLTENFLK